MPEHYVYNVDRFNRKYVTRIGGVMRYVIYGAGAIGGVIGGKLFQAGHEVVLIARGAHYDAVAARGLRLETPDAAVTLPVPVVPAPADAGLHESDVVILAMKSQDTPAALQALAGTAPSLAAVVCAQNGVANERAALRLFPNVYGMCVMLGATHLTPGVVQARSAPVSGLLDIGRWPAGSDHIARQIAADLSAATFSSEVRDDIPRWKWGKLLRNLANAVDALCGPQARAGEIAARAREEGIACLQKAGIPYSGPDEDRARREAVFAATRPADAIRRDAGSSSWQSLARSAGTIETDYLNGEIVLLGRLHDVPTPVNQILQTAAAQLAREHRSPGTVSEHNLLAMLT
jgi:2-dehydropantoate 2-reductase